MSELGLLIRNHKPTIVGITEAKPNNFRYDIEDAEIALDGYDMFGCNLHNKTGRGCAIYVKKNNVQANPVEFSSKFQESVWISVKLVGGDELLLIVYTGVIVEPMKITNVY